MTYKFIYAFDEALKDQLLAQGYNLITESDGKYVFENNPTLTFSAGKFEYILSNILHF